MICTIMFRRLRCVIYRDIRVLGFQNEIRLTRSCATGANISPIAHRGGHVVNASWITF